MSMSKLLLALAGILVLFAAFATSRGESQRIRCRVSMTEFGSSRAAYVSCPDDSDLHKIKLPKNGIEVGTEIECTESRKRIPFTTIEPVFLRRFKQCTEVE